MTVPGGRVLVTGGSGFIGRALVPCLSRLGWQVLVSGRRTLPNGNSSSVTWIATGDFANPVDWRPHLDGVTHIVHLAGIAHSRTSIPDAHYVQVNADATAALARAAHAAGVTRLVLLSSVRAQSGPAADVVLTERSAPTPTDAYGRSKLAAERAVAEALPGRWTVLRPALVLGAGAKGNLAALRRLARLPMPLPFGALHNRRSLAGLSNLVAAIAWALTAEAASERIFLAAEFAPVTPAELLGRMRKAIHRNPGLYSVPKSLIQGFLSASGRGALRPSLLGDLIVDPGALARAGWRAAAPLDDDIRAFMAQSSVPSMSPR